MSTPVYQPSHPDWQELLLEAIRQRNTQQALVVAQRYVHRFGMNAFEALLDSVVRADNTNDDPRTWLVPLLMQPSTPRVGPPQPPAGQLSSHKAPDNDSAASLDAAFAPLEIAFPPLPAPALSVGASGMEAISHSQHPVEELKAPLAGLDLQPGESLEATAGDEPVPASDESTPLQVSEDTEATSPPTIGLDDEKESPPYANKPREFERRVGERPAPIPPELEPWLVWLHGPDRPRTRHRG